ncbi:MAG: NAD(P)/FAD-dependent oxidoreductase [Fidelibacterota bacterium]
MECWDVIILGAGPAGLFAASELLNSNLRVLIVDKGDEPLKRKSVICGVGGAGAFSDGKLNLTSKIGGEPETFSRTHEEIDEYIEKVDRIFTELGVGGNYSGVNGGDLDKLSKMANKAGVEFIFGKQKHIGTDCIREIINKFYYRLSENGIRFQLNTPIEQIEIDGDEFIMKSGTQELRGRRIIAAPGRAGAYWLREQARKIGVETKYGPIDVGVRAEFPASIYEEITEVMYDAKFKLYTPTHDDPVRTFCTNPGGYIFSERYEGFTLVNGHSHRGRKSKNTNFALLSRITLTDPVEDTTEYGRAIAKLATTIGGGKPIIQRLKDLENGRRSNWERINRSSITPTLLDTTPGDISMALPHRIVVNMLEGLQSLDKIAKGIFSHNTLLYTPEIKFYDTKYTVNKTMETTVKGFYVAGDASGHSRGIVFSAVTGMIAADDIKSRFSVSEV